MKKNNLQIPILFFILVYANQGISGLPDQAIYYLTRETWLLSASNIGLISFITAFAWYIKILWGYLIDFCKIGKNSTRNYLYISYGLMISLYIFIIFFGLNIYTLIITGLLINCCIGLCDVANDSQMVIYEQKYNLFGKLQSIQWTALGFAGLLVALFGAKIADSFSFDIGYRVAYAFALILPILTLCYLKFGYKEIQTSVKKRFDFKEIFQNFKNNKFVFALLFILCLQLCPSFGTALMIKAREELMVSKMFLGYLSATGTVLGIIGYILYYIKFHKVPMKKLLYFMVTFTAISNLFYLYIPNQWYLVGYNVIFGAFSGITFLTLLAFFAKIVPIGNEGLFYAFITSISNLCGRGGNLLGGIIFDNYGYNTTVIVSTVLTFACLFFIPKLALDK